MQSKQKQIEKLQKQVKQFEAKGYKDTAAHQMLANLLKEHPVEGVIPRSTKKVTQETKDNDE